LLWWLQVTVGIDETTGQVGNGFDPSLIVPSGESSGGLGFGRVASGSGALIGNGSIYVAGDTITFTFQTPSYINNPPAVQHSATREMFTDCLSPSRDVRADLSCATT
jgi:hypothetical protein